MIKFEHCEVVGWEHAIRGMRNPMNSWDKSDSGYGCHLVKGRDFVDWDHNNEGDETRCAECGWCEPLCQNDYDPRYSNRVREFIVGPNDHDLMMRLRNAGTDHRKFMRMINVYVDITAPLYWWKEFDTYKVGTVANSCSTMHKIHAKGFELDDFSHEHLIEGGLYALNTTIDMLNHYRALYLKTKDKKYWWQMIQLLPSSYNQRRTIMMNYEVLANIYKSRKNHKLDEWRTFCSWIEELPYSEIIVGELEEDPKDIPISDEIMAEARRRILEEFENARLFPAPWPYTTEDTHPFLSKDLVLPASELRDGLLSGISADPNIAVVDAINGIIEEDEQSAI